MLFNVLRQRDRTWSKVGHFRLKQEVEERLWQRGEIGGD